VIGAVVEILIAKQTAPTLVAVALPRLLAGAVQTTWIADALVAQLSLPSQFAPIQFELKITILHKFMKKFIKFTYRHSLGSLQKPCSSWHPGKQMAIELNQNKSLIKLLIIVDRPKMLEIPTEK
jgi:hypothetical protein